MRASTNQEVDPRIYNKAVEMAHKSTQRFRLGAVVFRGKKTILGAAPNSKKTHPTYGSGPYFCLHAEIAAIRRAHLNGHSTEGCDIFVYRYRNNCSKPCKSCQEKFPLYGIRAVYYVNEDGQIERMWP